MSGHAQLHTEEGVTPARRTCCARGASSASSVLNTFTGDAEAPDELAAFEENVRAIADRGAGAGIRALHRDRLEPAADGRDRHPRSSRRSATRGVRFNYDPGNVVYYTGADPEDDIAVRAAAASATST